MQRIPAEIHLQIFQYLFDDEGTSGGYGGHAVSSKGTPQMGVTIQNLMHYAVSCKTALKGALLFSVKAPYFLFFVLCKTLREAFYGHFKREDMSSEERMYWISPYTVKLSQECVNCGDAYVLGGSHSRVENWFTTKNQDGKFDWVCSGQDAEKEDKRECGIKMSEDDLAAFRGLPLESEGDGMKRLRQWFRTSEGFELVRE